MTFQDRSVGVLRRQPRVLRTLGVSPPAGDAATRGSSERSLLMNRTPVRGRHARMLAILRLLQSGAGLNASALAGQLDVCRRTIFRDLNIMRQAGLDLYFDEHQACYRLSSRSDLTAAPAFSAEEITTLAAAVHLSPFQRLPDSHQLLRQSVQKLLANSPTCLRHHVARVMKSCRLGDEHAGTEPPTDEVVHRILAAISQRKVLRVTVVDSISGDEISTRLAPYQVMVSVDVWQVVGRSSHHRQVRSFDPRCLRGPEMTDEIYAIPRRYQPRY
jgi:predicted DNA-binding transcriptional regulator YafY